MSRSTDPIPLVIDTDVGTDVDDALALLLALASPEVRVIGVTIVDGDVALRARIAARLLGMAGRADVPVFKGHERPLGRGRMPTMRGHEGRGLLDVPYAGPEAAVHDTPAVDWLLAESRQRPFHLAAIGPYTNVAAAIERDADFPARLPGLTVMGGMVHQESFPPAWRRLFAATGRSGSWFDHNAQSDPTAASIAARAVTPLTWVTAEITVGLPLTRAGLRRIEAAGTPIAAALGRMARIWSDDGFRDLGIAFDGPSPFPSDAVACLHDPLAIASLFPGSWLTLRPHRLRYAVEDGLFRTIDDDDAATTAEVSVAADPAAFERFVVDRLEPLVRPAAR